MNSASWRSHAFLAGDASQLAVSRAAIYRNVRLLVRATASEVRHDSAAKEPLKDSLSVSRRDVHATAVLLSLSQLFSAEVRSRAGRLGSLCEGLWVIPSKVGCDMIEYQFGTVANNLQSLYILRSGTFWTYRSCTEGSPKSTEYSMRFEVHESEYASLLNPCLFVRSWEKHFALEEAMWKGITAIPRTSYQGSQGGGFCSRFGTLDWFEITANC